MITTIHDLKQRQLEDYENELREFTKYRPVTLVLPSLYSELERPALTKIVQELKEADYIQQIIIGLDQANPEQFKHAKEFFRATSAAYYFMERRTAFTENPSAS